MSRVLIILVCVLAGLVAVAWLVAALAFEAPDHARFDTPRPDASAHGRSGESAEHAAAVRAVRQGPPTPPEGDRAAQLQAMRQAFDQRGAATPIRATVTPVDVDGIAGEWLIAADVVPGRRLLYLHGGGHVMGSARSHRPITSRFAEATRAAVLAVNYRLLPEASRQDGIDDVRAAYRWILANGPDGPSPTTGLVVAGDSSGGNLALSTIAWARDAGLPAAGAAVVLSPHTDATFASPSLLRNAGTDVMQGTSLGPLVHAPRPITLWMGFLMNRMSPRNAAVSPLFGGLSGLPPTLIQVSASEMFLDDAVRYANKARAGGSHVELQVWPHTLHAWHAFATPETDEAFDRIAAFVAARLGRPLPTPAP
jgi:acetyl esterase/lipase